MWCTEDWINAFLSQRHQCLNRAEGWQMNTDSIQGDNTVNRWSICLSKGYWDNLGMEIKLYAIRDPGICIIFP